MNDCAQDSRRLVLRFGSFVALSSPRGISFVYWKIFKFAAWNLQNVIWSFIRSYSKTISCNIKWQVNHPQLKVTSQFSIEMHVILTNRLCIIFLKETNFLHFYNWKQFFITLSVISIFKTLTQMKQQCHQDSTPLVFIRYKATKKAMDTIKYTSVSFNNKKLSFSFVSRCSHVWCRSQRFDCILLVFFRPSGWLVMRDVIKHDALQWLVVFFNSSDWCILILAVHSVICSLGGPLSHSSPVVVFLGREHPRFWNFYSTIAVDVVRVKSYVNSLFDPACVVIRVTIHKLYFVPEWLVSRGMFWNGGGLGKGESSLVKHIY